MMVSRIIRILASITFIICVALGATVYRWESIMWATIVILLTLMEFTRN